MKATFNLHHLRHIDWAHGHCIIIPALVVGWNKNGHTFPTIIIGIKWLFIYVNVEFRKEEQA